MFVIKLKREEIGVHYWSHLEGVQLVTIELRTQNSELRTQNSELRNLFNIIHVFMCAITLPYLNTLGVLNT